MLAIATLRTEPGYVYLLETIADGSLQAAIAAVQALATFREVGNLSERMRAAVDERGERALTDALDRALD